jgi:ERCC4-type nuclease
MMTPSIQSILNSITVIIDSREHAEGNCANIMFYLDSHGIPYVQRCLKYGDYSFEVNGESYENRIVIERKSGLDEVSGNLAQNRERFIAEIERSKEAGAKFILMIENASWEKIRQHKYRTNFNPKSFIGTLKSLRNRYDIDIDFVQKEDSGAHIYEEFYYHLRNCLKEVDTA